VSQKTPHLWLATIFTHTVRLRQFWHKCCWESSNQNVLYFPTSPN